MMTNLNFYLLSFNISIFCTHIRPVLFFCFSEKTTDVLLTHICKHHGDILSNAWRIASGNPLHDLTNEILSILNTVDGTSFEEILENNVSENLQAEDGTSSVLDAETMIAVNHENKILSALNKSSSFVLTDAALPELEEITDESNITMRYLVVGRSYDSEHEDELRKADLEKQEILDKLKNMFSNEHEHMHDFDHQVTVTNTDDSKISTWTNSSEVAHLARSKCQMKRKTDGKESANHCQANCTCETLCRRYLRDDPRIDSTQRIPMEFFDQNTVKVLKKRSAVAIICGCLEQKVLKLTRYRHGWLIFINMDVLAMVRHSISDIRILSSAHLKWEQKSRITQKVIVLF